MTTVMASAAQLVLAAGTGGQQPGGQGQEFGSSGPVALILIIALFIAVAFLIRSMSKHLKKVPASFDEPEATDSEVAETPAPDGTEPAADSAEVGHGGER
jgi:hypothetical protein